MALLHDIGAIHSQRISTADAIFLAVRLYREIGTRVIVFDEVHNMLGGSFRQQRRVLNQLRWFSQELPVSLVCLGIDAAREALAADPQLARRFGMIQLAPWAPDADFRALIATIIRHLPLMALTLLDAAALKGDNPQHSRQHRPHLRDDGGSHGSRHRRTECITPAAIEHW